MTPLDKNYLLLQFRDKVYQKNATEFQSFFEAILEKGIKGFQKIRPYGNQGDGGNDGYIPDLGIYYQVYAPKEPTEKEAKAAEKFKDNFETLKNKWDQISKIKIFNFVFNDKYSGLSRELEKAKVELKKNNPDIEFKIFTPRDLEEIFFALTSEQMVLLGFDVDSRNALCIAQDFLEKLENELNKGNAGFVLKALENIQYIITEQNEDTLTLDYEIIKAKALQRIEEVPEAKDNYESILKRYPNDPRAPLLLAELYLNDENFDKNNKLLEDAEKIDHDYWLLLLEKLIREYRLGNKIDVSEINEQEFPSDPKIKADYYRIYSLFLERSGDGTKAQSFIEKAIYLNPEKFSGHDVKLSFLEQKLLQKENMDKIQSDGNNFLDDIEEIRQKFFGYGGLSTRNNIFLNIKKFHIFFAQENYLEFEKNAKETFELVLQCYFDYSMDRVLVDLLHFIELPQDDFLRLLSYLQSAEKPISDDLGRILTLQFIHKNTLTTEGKTFFEKAGRKNFVEFITDLENKNYEKALPFIQKDIHYAVNFSVIAKSFSKLRKKIIETLPNDGRVQKEKLLLLLNYDEGDIDEAFSILKGLDLSGLSYAECRPMLEVAEKKKAWDFVIILLEKLLQYEKDERIALQMKLKLFTANLNLEKFPEVIRIGETILENKNETKILDNQNKEILLVQTIYAWHKRGQYPNALKLLKKYNSLLKTFEAKISVEAETYLKNNDPQNALNSVVEAVKVLNRPSPEQYGSLFLIFSQIGNLMDFPLVSEKEIIVGSFVKLKDNEQWFFIGDQNELDALKVLNANRSNFLNKKLGEKVVFESKYSSEKKECEIENILPIEKYILWQSIHHAQKLSADHLWDAMEVIEVPTTKTGIDTKYLIARLEDQNQRGKRFFETYCKQNVPLALLAVSEGDLPNAIGRITNENKGFIKSNAGTLQEMETQKEVARQIITGEQFYIDGTSALVLSETGLFGKIYEFIPNFKVPQSVITLLLDIIDKFRYIPGQAGHMRYSQGKISFSPADFPKREQIQKNFEESINLLETKSTGVEVISSANKSSAFSEEKVPASLSDACILAQRDNTPVLTEDFLYLQMNELETKKKAPKYCSSLALIRVLYDQKKLDFEEYLNFFAYLSSYRFRFLPISIEDLEKALFGDGTITTVRTEELRKFNFPLTLSEEYGVPSRTATILMGRFLIKLIIDDSVLPEIVERVFAEVITTFPTNQNRKIFGRSLLIACVQAINKKQARSPFALGNRTQEKIDQLSRFIQSYEAGGIILP